MNILWSPQSRSDLTALYEFVALDDPQAAHRLVNRIVELAETLLPRQPSAGRPGRVAGTRELVVPGTPYIVAYRVVADTIQILRVYHSARRWPENF